MASCQQINSVSCKKIGSVSCKAYPDRALGITADNKIWVIVGTEQTQIPVFALLNPATGKALCVKGEEVVLTDFNAGHIIPFTESGLWTAEEGNGNEDIKIMLRTRKGNYLGTQDWNFSPSTKGQIVKVSCKAIPGNAMDIEDGNIRLLPNEISKLTQIWVKLEIEINNYNAFMLVNPTAGKVLCANNDKVVLAKIHLNNKNELWTENSLQIGDEFKNIISADGKLLTADDKLVTADGTKIILLPALNGQENQLWKFLTFK
ncbi:hypothetical protein SUGI_1133670 [Cryptomeria japonica]|nr:hypothetical protein SUGI_1133670 [Cryptomeria japonica]